MKARLRTGNPETVQFATFYLGDAAYGVDIRWVREIHKTGGITAVPLAAPYVAGVLNLRGRIVTVVDLCRRLALPAGSESKSFNVIVSHRGEFIGLGVDGVGDVISVGADQIESAPANLAGIRGKYVSGVFTMEQGLVALLDMDAVLESSPDEG